jgi:hypothetical protein
MPTKAQSDAGYAAALTIAQAEIANVDARLPVFARPRAEQEEQAHMDEIKACIRQMSDAAIDAAAKADAGGGTVKTAAQAHGEAGGARPAGA